MNNKFWTRFSCETAPRKRAILLRSDTYDPLAVKYPINRTRFSENISKKFGLNTKDPFSRIWMDKSGKNVADAEIWASIQSEDDEKMVEGSRFAVDVSFISEVLNWKKSDLVILIKLENFSYDHHTGGSFTRSIVVLHIKEDLSFKLYQGVTNKKS